MTEPILSAVRDIGDGNDRPYPLFEGREVQALKIKFSGAMNVDFEEVISVDDVIRVVSEYRVVGVRHYVDSSTGSLVREQVLKPIDGTADLAPWAPGREAVLRARR